MRTTQEKDKTLMNINCLYCFQCLLSHGYFALCGIWLAQPSQTQPFASNHSHGYDSSVKNFVWNTCSAPYIHNFMKNTG